MTFSLAREIRVYDDREGDCVVVKDDGDALGLIEIVRLGSNGNTYARLIVSPGQASLLARAIDELVAHSEKSAETKSAE